MKYTWIFLVLALFSLYIGNFLYRNQSPWNKGKINEELAAENIKTNSEAIRYITDIQDLGLVWDYINIRSFLLLFFFIDTGIVCGFASFHTLFDKLFFKKFYEEANWQVAVRRGVELAILVSLFVVLRLSASFSVFTAIPILLIIVGLEYVISGRSKAIQEKIIDKGASSKTQTSV
jgi:hypothetical protein